MTHTTPSSIKPKRKPFLISIGIVVFIIVLSALGFTIYNEKRTYLIGDNTKVVYLGKQTTGSNFIFSDQRELTSYYYGTDMTPEELARYWGGEVDISQGHRLSIKIQNKEYPVSLDYYKDKQDTYGSPPNFAHNTTKKYFFSTLSQNYEALKTAAGR